MTEITQLLKDARQGNVDARDRLIDVVYDELKQQARFQLRRQVGGVRGTLQTTMLLHEAYLKLFENAQLDVAGRAHFFALASRAMRQVLIDHFRRSTADKRGGVDRPLSLKDWDVPVESRGELLLALDEALERLSHLDERLAKVVEWKYFGGLTEREIADLLGVTDRTVRNDWRKAKAWLYREMSR